MEPESRLTETNRQEVEVLPHQVPEACKSLRRSHCEVVRTEDGLAGKRRIVYDLPPPLPVNVDKFRDDGRLVFDLEPERHEDDLAVRWVWRTDCRRYSVARHLPKLPGFDPDWSVWQRIDEPCAKERLVSRDHKSLKRALDSLLVHHQVVYGSEYLPGCNRSELEKAAKDWFFEVGKPQDVPGAYNKEGVEAWAEAGRQPYQADAPDYEEGEKIMKVKEKAGLDLMVALGYKATSAGQLKGRLERIEDHGQEYEALSPSQKRLFDSLRKVVAEGKAVEVVKGDAPAKATGKAKVGGGKKMEVKNGSTIEREYRGKTYSVKATDDGFTCDGKTYSSLTALAMEITGAASISGPRFFGLAK